MKKRIVRTLFAFFLVIVIATVPLFAWLAQYRTSFLVVVGNIEIAVQGWVQIEATGDEIQEPPVKLEDEKDVNVFKDVPFDKIFAFKFKVTNVSERDAVLSIRFNNLSEIIFENFLDYHEVNGVVGSDLEKNILAAANANTAKLAYIISDMYYCVGTDDPEGEVKKTVLIENEYLWQYSAGQEIISEVPLPCKAGDTEKPVYIYFKLKNNQTTLSIESYRNWLCGYVDSNDNTVLGYGQTQCAKLLGSTFAALGDTDKALVDKYLKYFNEKEMNAIKIGEGDLSHINLTLKYFEFIGENTAANLSNQ